MRTPPIPQRGRNLDHAHSRRAKALCLLIRLYGTAEAVPFPMRISPKGFLFNHSSLGTSDNFVLDTGIGLR